MSNDKTCNKCWKEKEASEFYMTRGYTRKTCKKCMIKKNALNAKKRGYSFSSYEPEKMKSYMKAYREANKDKITAYRKAFLERHPDYYTHYYRKLRDEGRTKTPTKQFSGRKNVTRKNNNDNLSYSENKTDLIASRSRLSSARIKSEER